MPVKRSFALLHLPLTSPSNKNVFTSHRRLPTLPFLRQCFDTDHITPVLIRTVRGEENGWENDKFSSRVPKTDDQPGLNWSKRALETLGALALDASGQNPGSPIRGALSILCCELRDCYIPKAAMFL